MSPLHPGHPTMSEAQSLFAVLRQSADADCVAALERLVRDAPDRRLARINVLDFAQREGLDEERTIAAFLQAAQIGLFDMSWNVLCPSCSGVLDANTSLKTVRSERVLLRLLQSQQRADARRHGRGELHGEPARAADRGAQSRRSCRSGSTTARSSGARGVDLPEDGLEAAMQQVTLDAVELPPGEKAHPVAAAAGRASSSCSSR